MMLVNLDQSLLLSRSSLFHRMSLLLKQHIEQITSKLSDEEFAHILSFFKPVKRKKHQFLVQENENVPYEFWVVKGCLKEYYLDANGKEHILKFATETWWTTDYGAFYNREKASIYIDCVEDCELLAISLENREQLCKESHKMERFWRVRSNSGYVALQKRILSLLRMSAEDRFKQFVDLYPDLLQRVPKKCSHRIWAFPEKPLVDFK
ncbi:Crp/Fnr family transcriptional regulator [Flagellimonas allohymeniacidonis]|uniref:Crp/Fnr family transcriptional regulator n=1 Tax=Flagellimonas allohymeniacidonis TaxID=2517819 RepID=UPI00267BA378|nr:Crp/Fnr family transcriptional regulator [Allomuricauda hymeniacidonis]